MPTRRLRKQKPYSLFGVGSEGPRFVVPSVEEAQRVAAAAARVAHGARAAAEVAEARVRDEPVEFRWSEVRAFQNAAGTIASTIAIGYEVTLTNGRLGNTTLASEIVRFAGVQSETHGISIYARYDGEAEARSLLANNDVTLLTDELGGRVGAQFMALLPNWVESLEWELSWFARNDLARQNSWLARGLHAPGEAMGGEFSAQILESITRTSTLAEAAQLRNHPLK